MNKKWSSFKSQQLITENWRKFVEGGELQEMRGGLDLGGASGIPQEKIIKAFEAYVRTNGAKAGPCMYVVSAVDAAQKLSDPKGTYDKDLVGQDIESELQEIIENDLSDMYEPSQHVASVKGREEIIKSAQAAGLRGDWKNWFLLKVKDRYCG